MSGAREIIKLYKDGFSMALMIDQRVREGIKLNFFGKPASTTTIPAQIVKKFGCKIVPIYIERIDKFYYKMKINSPLNFDKNHSIEKHLDYLGEMFEPFTKVASQNSNSWFPTYRSAKEISTPNESNRFVGFPYTKYMNAIMEVDQSASLIIMSEKKANEYSVPKSKRIYLHGCADINEVWNVTERPDLHKSKAIRLMGEKGLSMAKWNIDEIDFFDLYSCFPSMVELGREALDIPETTSKPLTVTGGLPFFGGAGNNYVSHSIATMMDKLRENNTENQLGHEGTRIEITCQLVDFDEKRIHLCQSMYNAEEGYLAAESEVIYLHVDALARKVAPMKSDLFERIKVVHEAHKQLEQML